MLNLDELKHTLNQHLGAVAEGNKSVSDIQAMLAQKATSTASKLKQSLWYEIVFSLIFSVLFFIAGFFITNKAFSVYFITGGFAGVAFTVLLYLLYNKTNQLLEGHLNVKQNLTNLHYIISVFVKRYMQFTMGLIPVCFGFLWCLKAYNHNFHSVKIETILYLFIIPILAVPAYFFTKWYLKKLYGNTLLELKQLLQELEN